MVTSAGDGLVIVAVSNCVAQDNDGPGRFFWPGFTTARPDLGVTFVDPTIVTVVNVDTADDSGQPLINPRPFGSFGVASALIAAPGSRWRGLDVQRNPNPSDLDTATTDCPVPQGFVKPAGVVACTGTSFAAPVVSGAGILVFANNPTLAPSQVKARLLDNANTGDANLPTAVQGGRLLDVAAAVGP
jgi:subtilisin family serine protease